MSSIVHHFNSIGWIWNWSYSPDTLNSDWNWRYFVLCYLEIRWMTLENNRAHLLYYRYIKLCASFQIHQWNQSCVTVRKLLIRVNIDFFVLCDLEIQWMTLKNKRAPLVFYTTLSFVHHFKAMGEFKLELQFGNAQFGSKSAFFLSRVTLKFDRWPWKTIGYLSYAASGFVHHFIAIGEFKLELQSGNTQFGSKSTILFTMWPWNLTDDLEKW